MITGNSAQQIQPRVEVWGMCIRNDRTKSGFWCLPCQSKRRQLRTLISPYMTTGKTIALTRRTFVGKVMSLIFHMLSKWVIAFLPRSKHLLTSWLQSPFAVILQPKKIKSVTVSIVSPSICYEVLGPEDIIFIFWMLSQLFHSPLSLASRGFFVPLHFLR